MTPEQHEIERRRAWVAFAIERAKTAQPFERQEKTPMVGGYSKVAVTVSMQAAGFANDMLAAYDARFPAPVEREAMPTPTEPDWREHTPGDPMPVLRGTKVDIKMKCGRTLYGVTLKPAAWWADLVDPGSQIIQWRPAQ